MHVFWGLKSQLEEKNWHHNQWRRENCLNGVVEERTNFKSVEERELIALPDEYSGVVVI